MMLLILSWDTVSQVIVKTMVSQAPVWELSLEQGI